MMFTPCEMDWSTGWILTKVNHHNTTTTATSC